MNRRHRTTSSFGRCTIAWTKSPGFRDGAFTLALTMESWSSRAWSTVRPSGQAWWRWPARFPGAPVSRITCWYVRRCCGGVDASRTAGATLRAVDARPDPDALLVRVQEEEARRRRGKLKVFFGAAAGRGQT